MTLSRSLPSLCVLLLALAPPARGQYTYLGPSKCLGCHDHERQAKKWQKEEPAALKGKAHYNTRKQLEAPKSAAYAKAVGLADPYDLKGSCVKCHATVFRGDANAGVSCESCHGPASAWNDIHQVKGSHAKSVTAGMTDFRGKPANVAKVCVDCHVTPDKRLAAAGHPAGERFDAGVSLQKLVHWNAAYDYAQVSAAGRKAMAGRLPAAGSTPSASQPSGTKGLPTTPRPRVAAPAPRPAAPAPPPAPWDWDQPIRPLPVDYVPEPEPEPAPAEEAAPTAEPPVAPAAPALRPRRIPRPAPEPEVPPSIAEDIALPPAVAGVPEPESISAALAPAAAEGTASAPPPRSSTNVAGLRGQAVDLLDRLLRSGARTPGLPPPATPAEFAGPDSELLRLQDEVLSLALEALRRPEP